MNAGNNPAAIEQNRKAVGSDEKNAMALNGLTYTPAKTKRFDDPRDGLWEISAQGYSNSPPQIGIHPERILYETLLQCPAAGNHVCVVKPGVVLLVYQ
jgi:hypothetical protein